MRVLLVCTINPNTITVMILASMPSHFYCMYVCESDSAVFVLAMRQYNHTRFLLWKKKLFRDNKIHQSRRMVRKNKLIYPPPAVTKTLYFHCKSCAVCCAEPNSKKMMAVRSPYITLQAKASERSQKGQEKLLWKVHVCQCYEKIVEATTCEPKIQQWSLWRTNATQYLLATGLYLVLPAAMLSSVSRNEPLTADS